MYIIGKYSLLVLLIFVSLFEFGNTVAIQYYEGCAIKFTDSSEKQIYLSLNGTLFPIANPDTMESLGFEWTDITYAYRSTFYEYKIGDQLNVYKSSIQAYKESIKEALKQPKTRFNIPDSALYVYNKILSERAKLQKYLTDIKKEAQCIHQNFLTISKFRFGRFGNVLTEVKNAIFIAEQTNQTFIIPDWILNEYLASFDLSALMKYYCVLTLKEYRERSYVGYIETLFTDELYSAITVWTSNTYSDFNTRLPTLNITTLSSVEDLYIGVCSALWSSVKLELVAIAAVAISKYLGNTTEYLGDCFNYV